MVLDEPAGAFSLAIREFERPGEFLGDAAADDLVVMECDPAVLKSLGEGFPNVVQERGECQGERGLGGQMIEHQERVIPQVAAGEDRLGLLQALHGRDRGQDLGE